MSAKRKRHSSKSKDKVKDAELQAVDDGESPIKDESDKKMFLSSAAKEEVERQ